MTLPVRPWPLLLLLLVVAVAPAAAADNRPASRVVARGARTLAHALELATYEEAWRDPSRPRPVAIVVDSTPFTAFAAADLEAALLGLDGRVGTAPGAWRIGRLGQPLAPRERGPAPLRRRLRAVLAKESQVTSTCHALRRTLSGFREPGGVVVYVADRHFEDDSGLEEFIADLARRDQRLSVIGPEAGFQQPYDDTCFLAGPGPFGPPSSEASPWRTGETAWPHLPGRVTVNTWYFHETASFPTCLADRLRDYLRKERSGRAPDRKSFLEELDSRRVPRISVSTVTPSSYGPYGTHARVRRDGGHVLPVVVESAAPTGAGLRLRPLQRLRAGSSAAIRDPRGPRPPTAGAGDHPGVGAGGVSPASSSPPTRRR